MIPSLPKKTLRNLAIFAGALAAIVGLMVVPSYFAIGMAETTREEIRAEVNEQRQLAPVFGKLVKKRRELNAVSSQVPKREPLARDDAAGVSDHMTDLAIGHQMQLVGITADLNALVSEVRLMKVDLVLRGDLQHYDALLKELIQVPHLEFIEKLRISSVPGGQEFKMRVWFALK